MLCGGPVTQYQALSTCVRSGKRILFVRGKPEGVHFPLLTRINAIAYFKSRASMAAIRLSKLALLSAIWFVQHSRILMRSIRLNFPLPLLRSVV